MIKPSLLPEYVPLLAMMVTAAVTDLRARRIPNWLSLAMIIGGLVQSFLAIRLVSPGASALGMLTGFGLTFILFALGALGAGDVKLMAGVGAWIGPGPILVVFVLNSIIGMVIVLSQAIVHGRLRTLLTNTAVLTINLVHLQDVGLEHAQATGRSCRSVDRPLPYAVPVLLSVIVMMVR